MMKKLAVVLALVAAVVFTAPCAVAQSVAGNNFTKADLELKAGWENKFSLMEEGIESYLSKMPEGGIVKRMEFTALSKMIKNYTKNWLRPTIR